MTSAALYMCLKLRIILELVEKIQNFCHGKYMRKMKWRDISRIFCVAGNFLATGDEHL